MAKHKALSF